MHDFSDANIELARGYLTRGCRRRTRVTLRLADEAAGMAEERGDCASEGEKERTTGVVILDVCFQASEGKCRRNRGKRRGWCGVGACTNKSENSLDSGR
jgi:hypothetical protein